MIKENFLDKSFIDEVIFLEYIKAEIKKRGLENIIKRVNFDKDGINEYNMQKECITINLNDILYKSNNNIENMITRKEQKTGIINDQNNVNIYNLYIINHELEHVSQAKIISESKDDTDYLKLRYALLLKTLLLIDNIFTFKNRETYDKYHDFFFSEYDADINSFINTLNFINGLNIDEINANIEKFNMLIAQTILRRYKNVHNKRKFSTPYENFLDLYNYINRDLKISANLTKYIDEFKEFSIPSSQIERLKLGLDIDFYTYEYLTLVSKKKHKTLNLFNDIMNL